MLWPSIRRWKFQRSRIGKLPASVWCLTMVCSAIGQRAGQQDAAEQQQVPRCSRPQPRRRRPSPASRRRGPASRTAAPRRRRSPPSAASWPRCSGADPWVQDQRKATKPFGGTDGAASGYGWTSDSNHASTQKLRMSQDGREGGATAARAAACRPRGGPAGVLPGVVPAVLPVVLHRHLTGPGAANGPGGWAEGADPTAAVGGGRCGRRRGGRRGSGARRPSGWPPPSSRGPPGAGPESRKIRPPSSSRRSRER